MKLNQFTAGLFATLLLLGSTTQASDVRINGFISVVGGTTLSEGNNLTTGNKSTFQSNAPTNGRYDDDISFKPDTIFGLQVSSNLGEGLSVTGQITGAGGEDFDANVAWAYLTYEFNDAWSMMAGRQRIPFFMNSDYLDVGYAYHWMRPPTETDVAVDDFEGVSFIHTGYIGDWDSRLKIYAGENTAEAASLGPLGIKDMVGVVYNLGKDNLQLRATYMVTDFYVDALAPFGQGPETPVSAYFFGFAGKWNFGNSFIMAEYVGYGFDDVIFSAGWDEYTGGYVSFGHQVNSITPHITYSFSELTTASTTNGSPNGGLDGSEDSSSITVGVRWDFHPKAAFKVEYQTRSDDSTANIIAAKGNLLETDLFSVGIDVIF